jgi:hypothetical protein
MILELNLKRRRFNHKLIVSSPTIGLRAKQNRDPHKCPRFPPIWHQGEMKTKTSLRREEKRREFETIKSPPSEMPIASCDDLFLGMEW